MNISNDLSSFTTSILLLFGDHVVYQNYKHEHLQFLVINKLKYR